MKREKFRPENPKLFEQRKTKKRVPNNIHDAKQKIGTEHARK